MIEHEEVIEKVRDCLRMTFCSPNLEISRDTRADDIDGWDSLSHAIIVFRLEKTCNVRISSEAAAAFRNVGDLVDQIVVLKRSAGK